MKNVREGEEEKEEEEEEKKEREGEEKNEGGRVAVLWQCASTSVVDGWARAQVGWR